MLVEVWAWYVGNMAYICMYCCTINVVQNGRLLQPRWTIGPLSQGPIFNPILVCIECYKTYFVEFVMQEYALYNVVHHRQDGICTMSTLKQI